MTVKFNSAWDRYFPGDVATFAKDREEKLVSAGVAAPHKSPVDKQVGGRYAKKRRSPVQTKEPASQPEEVGGDG